MNKQYRWIIVVSLVLLFSIGTKCYQLGDVFSSNGIDEGIHLLQAKMMAEGYNYYSDLEGDQPPLALLVYSLFNGDIIPCRAISIALFLISLVCIFGIASLFRRKAALLSVVLIALDFMLWRESRLASLDMFSAVLLCAASYFFIIYLEKEGLLTLGIAGTLFSLSLMTKLIPVFLVIFALSWIIYQKKMAATIIFLSCLVIPVLFLLFLYTPEELITGVLLRQMHRSVDIYLKLSLFLFLGVNFVYLLAFRRWDLRDKKIRYLVAWILLILGPIMIQGLTAPHHFIYISYPFAVLASVAMVRGWNIRKQTLMATFIVFSVLLTSFLICTAPSDLPYHTADKIAEITTPESLVISGNPIVNVMADRNAPPNLTNLAYHHYPPTTADKVIYWLQNEQVHVIVLYYRLAYMDDLKSYLRSSENWKLVDVVTGRGELIFHGYELQFARDKYEIYLKVT